MHFIYHRKVDFQLHVEYRYDSGKLKDTQVIERFNDALNVYRNVVRHVDILTEDEIYTALRSVVLPDVKVLNVRMMREGADIPYLEIPATRLHSLTSVAFDGKDIAV